MPTAFATPDIQMDCAFCLPAIEFDMFPDHVIRWPLRGALGDEVAIKTAVGMLCVGNILTTTTEHYTSFAGLGNYLGAGAMRELNIELDTISDYWGERLDDDYFRTEHGSDGGIKGACIEHAHQQWFPGKKIGEKILSLLEWRELSSYDEIIEYHGSPYLYLGFLKRHYIIPNPDIRSQWVRMQVARELAKNDPSRDPNHYDWFTFDGGKYLERTWEILNGG
jgi:hypothetical protein